MIARIVRFTRVARAKDCPLDAALDRARLKLCEELEAHGYLKRSEQYADGDYNAVRFTLELNGVHVGGESG